MKIVRRCIKYVFELRKILLRIVYYLGHLLLLFWWQNKGHKNTFVISGQLRNIFYNDKIQNIVKPVDILLMTLYCLLHHYLRLYITTTSDGY